MVNNSDIKVSYRGNGQNINFPFSFPFFDADYICVKILDEITGNVTTLDSDYYVDTVGSKVIYPGYGPGTEPPEADRPPILPETSVLTIYRDTEVSQLIELGEKFPLPVIESALDKITEILQENKEEISRSVKVDITSTVTPDQLIEEIRNSTATAIEAKITAVASAAAAEASKTNAATSASAAATSQQAAATSETNAAASAEAAAQSATDLETAVTTATTKAAEALTSQQAAATSASAALTSQQAAAGSATAAAASATAAAGSATAAAGSATAAESYANEAEYYTHIVTGFPVGTRISWLSGSTTPPNGFLICNGDAVSRIYYADLYAAIGTQYGPGDGETTFNLPNLTDEVTGGRYIIKAFDVESSGSAAEAAARAALSASNAAASATNAATGATNATQSATSAAASATQAANTAASINYHAGYRQASTTYTAGSMATHSALPYGWYLKATTGGTTSASELVITTPEVGGTVTDGTVEWTIYSIAGGGSGGGVNTLQRDTEYTAGAIAYSPLLDSTQRLEAVTNGTTASADVIVTVPTTGTYITDGTVTWIVTDIRDGDRVGDITLHPTLLPGHILADGATVTASDYPRLLAWAQANNMITTNTADVSKYRYDAGNDKLVVPNAINRVLQGAASVETKAAGLPNATISFTATKIPQSTPYVTTTSTNTGRCSVESTTISKSLSQSNNIYGASTTVQPPAITQIPQIKY